MVGLFFSFCGQQRWKTFVSKTNWLHLYLIVTAWQKESRAMRTSCGLRISSDFAKKMVFWKSETTNEHVIPLLAAYPAWCRWRVSAALWRNETRGTRLVRCQITRSLAVRSLLRIDEVSYSRETTLVSKRAENFSIDRTNRRSRTTIHHPLSGSATKHEKIT